MSLLVPETLEEKFVDEMRKAGYVAGFCPNSEWFLKVTRHLMKKFEITEKSVDNTEAM